MLGVSDLVPIEFVGTLDRPVLLLTRQQDIFRSFLESIDSATRALVSPVGSRRYALI